MNTHALWPIARGQRDAFSDRNLALIPSQGPAAYQTPAPEWGGVAVEAMRDLVLEAKITTGSIHSSISDG